jgi:hypothetical protein
MPDAAIWQPFAHTFTGPAVVFANGFPITRKARLFDGSIPRSPLSTTSRTEIAPVTGNLTHPGAFRERWNAYSKWAP